MLAHFHDEFPEVVEELTLKRELPPVEDKVREIITNFMPRFTKREESAEGAEAS